MQDSAQILRCDRLSLNQTLKSVEYDGQPINLSPNSFDLLAHLMQKSPAVVSVDELLAAVWHNKVVNRETVKQQIKSLRDQLGPAAFMVESVRGFGYQIKASERSSEPRVSLAAVFRLHLLRWGLLMLLILVGVLFWLSFSGNKPSIQLPLNTATLPFKLLDSEDRDLVLLLQDELTNMLSRQEDVRAIAISAIEHAKFQNFSAEAYAEKLGVDMLFEGSIQENEAGYQVSVRMVWTENSVAVWRDSIIVKDKDRQQLIVQTSDNLRDFIIKKVAYLKSKNHEG